MITKTTTTWMVTLAIAGLISSAITQDASARKIQGFETGDPAFSSIGDGSFQGIFQTGIPPEGSAQYLLTTISGTDGDGLSPVSGNNAVGNTALQIFFHGISLAQGQQGSGILIPFTVGAGDTTLTLQYDFLSNEPAQTTVRNDFAFAALFNSSNVLQGTVNPFATVNGSSFTLFGLQDPFFYHTGYQTLTISLAGLVAGNYTLGLGVDDRTSLDGASGILLDNVQVVPEPTATALMVIGGIALFLTLPRLVRQKQ